MKKKIWKARWGHIVKVVVLLSVLGAIPVIHAQSDETKLTEVKSALFQNALAVYRDAKSVEAELLAPNSFRAGVAGYNKASNDFKKQKSLDDIRKNLKIAEESFKKAVENTKLANLALGTTIQARKDAISVESAKYSESNWKQAEEKFQQSVRELEDGDMNNSKKKAKEAEQHYRNAELESIKINYLNETYELFEVARKEKVKNFAPKTLLKAQELAQLAEKELSQNRYDTDVAAIFARQAKREAKHALYLTELIKKSRAQKESSEDLLLYNETYFSEIADAFNLIPNYDLGLNTLTRKIVGQIAELHTNVNNLNADIFDLHQERALRTAKMAELEKENGILSEKLGGVEKEKSDLAQKLDAQAKIRELYNVVEALFTPEEAILIRKGNDINIRLMGLSFASGQATIETRFNEFLSKVSAAIELFPKSKITIEGHTDSYGSDESNLRLSNDRAEAVRYYLSANVGISSERIEAIGYGESRPIATNETAAGRAKNRRIELIIHPELGDGLVQ